VENQLIGQLSWHAARGGCHGGEALGRWGEAMGTVDTEVTLEGFDPFDARVQQEPQPYYARMRDEQPVFRADNGLFVISRYDDCLDALRRPDVFSNSFGGPGTPGTLGAARDDPEMAEIAAQGYPPVPTLLVADPPAHTRYRKLVGRAFTPRRVQGLVPEIERVADDLFGRFAGNGRVEIVTEFAVPLPVRVIAYALGVPADRQADFKRWSDDSIAGIGAVVSRERSLEMARGVVEFQQYFATELERRRQEPCDDMLSDLVHARIEDPDGDEDTTPLTMPEMLSILQQLLVAGNETTTKLVTEICRMLVENPEAAARVREDRGLVPNVVEEALRLATPTQGMFRKVTRDTIVGGVVMPQGSMCVLMYASANRDDAEFPDSNAFVPDRTNAKEHLAFGKGIHYCIGASLARAEAIVALDRILDLRDLRYAPGNDFAYEPSFILRGLRRLDLEFTPGAA
jgi:cytochrome P450